MGKVFNKNVNSRRTLHLCPNCYSKLDIKNNGELVCTGNQLKHWENLAEEYFSLGSSEKTDFLSSLSNITQFLSLLDVQTKTVVCDYNSASDFSYEYYLKKSSVRVPDPLAVKSKERLLGRNLTEIEREEGYIFEDGTYLEFIDLNNL